MEELAAFLEGGAATGARFAAHGFAMPEQAAAVLAGRRVMGMGEIWARASEGLPEGVAAACLAACGDRAEAAALLMGRAEGDPVGLEEVLAVRSEGVFALARRMEPVERAWFFRLISGARRSVVVEEAGGPGECLAVLTMVEGAQGQFAVRRGNGLVPLVKLPLGPHGAEVLAWARGAVLERFGPLRSVRAEQVFRIAWEAKVVNKRRKLGFDLVGARVVDWERGASVDQIAEG
ncbi:hypothetical protein [Stagnihabitans tardus]|uniref:Uncharacterized protein n=1 Tax=Stagnihabitans tardus TaxID=2699202 RepID=A0AAE4Y961_9RHOB|nr:hypothetical protein [Stagnihabitans tardus]NBZ87023.1 hypothetical protein [Stagnihabitans tardus]